MTALTSRSPLPPLSPNASLRWDVVRRLLPPAGATVLEIGCGMGGFAARLVRRYRYVGLEPDPYSYAVAASRVAGSGGGDVRQGDLTALERDEDFDLVCAFEVIEHVEDDASALAEWCQRVRPGGHLLLSTPAWQHRFGPADVMAGHYRRYDPPVLRSRLQAAGLADIGMVHFGMPLGYVLEAGRNAVGRRFVRARAGASMAERTGGSGRLLQPNNAALGVAVAVGTAPFRLIQRAFPDIGPGLVARARRPR